jgi:DNA repair exonuclease SbcCD ATPase subunit
MEIKKILIGEYDKIYHISDIHIRNTQYHEEEYLYVFNKLYKYISETKTDKSVIVICGDILHNEQINNISEILCIDFFDNLNKLLPTIIIAGNHDYNIGSEYDNDSLHTILYKRQKELNNIYYLRESGIYEVGNIYFGVSSLINNKECKFISANEIPDDKIKIALYHGAIINTKTNTGFINDGIQIKKFKNYDYVLLGDIHKYQYLDENKKIGYSSSLISQNFSETDNYHGVLVWDLKNKKSYYKILDNPYRYIEIKIDNNKIYYDNKKSKLEELELPIKSKIRFKIINSSINVINNIKSYIKKKYPNVEIKHEKKEIEEIITSNIKNESIITDNKIYTEEMINQELEKIEEIYREDVKRVLNSELKSHSNHLNSKKIWRLLKLEFSNLLTYGENNIFDFDKLENYEITGLCGRNSIGKSSLIDILLIGIFNDFSRNDTTKRSKHKHGLNSSIINHNYKSFKIKTSFQVGQNIYYILKEGTIKEKNGVLFFTKYDLVQLTDKTEKVLSCGITHKENTLKHIESLIGTYNDFCVSSLSFQSNVNHNFDFYKMSSYQRKKFLNEHFNLEYFDEIKKKYTKLLSDTKLKLSNIKGKLENNNFCEKDIEKIDTIKKEIKELQINFNKLKKDNSDLKTQKDNLKFIHFDKSFTENEFEQFEFNKKKITKKINKLNLKLENFKLIKNKQQIIYENNNFENMKKDKIEKLLFQIKKNNSNIDFSKFQNFELEELVYMFNIQLNETRKCLNNYDNNKRDNIVNNINFLEKNINSSSKLIIEEDDQYNISDEDKQNYDLNNYSKLKHNFYNKNYKTYIDNKNIFELLTKIHNNCNLNCSHCINTNNLINEYLKNNDLNFDFDIDKIINKYNKYNKLYKIHTYIENIKNKEHLVLIQSILNNYKTELSDFDNKVKYYNKQIDIFENNIISIENTIIKNKIKEIQQQQFDNYILLQEQLDIYSTITNKIEKYKSQLLEIDNNIENYKIYKNISNTNQSNKILFQELTLKIEENEKQLFEYNNNIITLELHVEKLLTTKKIYGELIEQFNILDKDKNIFTHINKLVDSNGLPLKIIQNKLKYIQDGVSNMLYKIIKKKIIISEDITNIYIDIIDDKGLGSSYFGGMEFFICTLCFKIFLCSVLNIPFSGLLFIDEGVSALDKEHIDNFNIVTDFLKEYYPKVILITHIKEFNNFTSSTIKIKTSKINNNKYTSYISFT